MRPFGDDSATHGMTRMLWPTHFSRLRKLLQEVTEQNLKLAQATYERLMNFFTGAMDAWMEAMPSYPATAGIKEVQGRAAPFAKEKEPAFTFSAMISNEPISPEILTLQMEFAHDWMQMFTAQTQEIYGLIQEVLDKTEPGALHIRARTQPLTPWSLASGNTRTRCSDGREESASQRWCLEKIGKARTIRDVLTLQAQFARKQMEAYVAQAQDLRRLIMCPAIAPEAAPQKLPSQPSRVWDGLVRGVSFLAVNA